MGIMGTALLYAIAGMVVAAALALQNAGERGTAKRIGLFLVWTLLWPFFAPLLFGRALDQAAADNTTDASPVFDPRLRTAQERLLAALQGVDGVAKEVLVQEVARVQKLTDSLAAMESRLSEMDALLASPEFDASRAEAALRAFRDRGLAEDDPRVASLRSRERNIEQLHTMRERAAQDLERALLKMEEMHSQVLLLRFAHRPETELVELVREISATVEGLTAGMMASA